MRESISVNHNGFFACNYLCRGSVFVKFAFKVVVLKAGKKKKEKKS